MNIFFKTSLILLFLTGLFSCGNNKDGQTETPDNIDETALLFDFISKSGDLINSPASPFVLTAEEVYENLGKYLILDIRDTADYYAGHIDGAIQVDEVSLFDFLESRINASAYEKVVIACYSGQTTTFYVALLQLIGYKNLYSLKYGMSGWSDKIVPNKFSGNMSDKYTNLLEVKKYTAEKSFPLPSIKTGKTGAYAILFDRALSVMHEGFKPVSIKIDTLMKAPSTYFIINYWNTDFYNRGHLPGAICFEPRKSLTKDNMLKFVPTDKPVVVYCQNGHSSAMVVAYLRVLGYDARSLSFGADGFMHNFSATFNEKAFNPLRDIASFPLIEGKNPNLQTTEVQTGKTAQKEEKVPAGLPVKKKQKTSGGGC